MEIEAKIAKALDELHWLGHASFRIDSSQGAIYIDPFQLKGAPPKAALLLITHDHFDHYSPEDIAKITSPSTKVCAPLSAAQQMNREDVIVMEPGMAVEPLPGIKVRATASYNLNKAFHPKLSGWVGYIVEVDGVSFFHCGDSDFIPELIGLQVDIAMLPVSGTYVMTAEEAAEAALAMKPKVVVPMHYGAIVGNAADAEELAGSLAGMVNVKVLAQE